MLTYRKYIKLKYLAEVTKHVFISQRDKNILKDLTTRQTYPEIAQKYNLSEERVRQIAYTYLAHCFIVGSINR